MLKKSQEYRVSNSTQALLTIFGLAILLWLPFGLNRTVGAFEEWSQLGRLQQGQSLMFANPTRPLNLTAYSLINLLFMPDLGLGYNLVLFGLFIAKSWLIYLILRRLIPQNPYIALMTALLYMVYPADTGLFTFRAMGAQISITLGLTAIYLLVRCWQKPSRRLWFAIAILQITSLWVNEVMYPALFASPVLLLWLERRFTPRFWRLTGFWLIMPALLSLIVLLNLILPSNANAYIVRRIEESQETNIINAETIINRIMALYVRHVSEWERIVAEFSRYTVHLPFALAAGSMMGVMGWQHFKRVQEKLPRRCNLMLLAGGLAIILIGHTPFLLLSYQGVHWRVYFVSSLGAALFVAVLLYWLTWRLPVLTIALSGSLLALASLSGLHQHAFYADTSIYIQRLFAGIVAQATQIDSDATIVIMDVTSLYESQWMTSGFDSVLAPALSYVYGDLVKAAYCNVSHVSRWGEISCDMRSAGIYRVFLNRASMIPYSQMIVFQTKVGGGVELVEQIPGAQGYNPHRLIRQGNPLPDRVWSFFTCWPLDSCFPPNSPPQAEIRLDFDRVVRGVGWESGDPGRQQLWTMRARRSTIIINPVTDRTLEMRFRLSHSVGRDVIDSLRFEVNGHFVSIEEIDPADQIFRAILPSKFLQDETELAFNLSRTVGMFNLGLEFDWLEIKPLAVPDYIRVEFDRPVDGTGWEQPVDQSRLWTLDTRAVMNLFLPTDKDLEVRFKIDLYLQQDILDSLELSVNGHAIMLEKSSEGRDHIFSGIIPKSALRPESELVFTTNRVISPASLGVNEDTRGLGLLFDWLEIRPAP